MISNKTSNTLFKASNDGDGRGTLDTVLKPTYTGEIQNLF
jgi:hypothetical protein